MKTVGRFLLTVVIVIAACAGGYELWDYYMWSPWTRDAHVQADVVTVAPDVAGFVTDLRVKDNQFVHKGDVLMVIDQARYTRALATADANVAAQKANMDNLEQQWTRRKKLTELSISNEAKQSAELTANQADAAYQQAIADRSTAQLNLDRTVVRASVNGYVTNLTLVVGQYAAVGVPVMAVIDNDSYRITGFFEETKMPAIKPGDKAEIHLLMARRRSRVTSKASRAASPTATTRTGRSSWSTPPRPSNGCGSLSGSRSASTSMMCRRGSLSVLA
jgi:RND family efflux transporter MFP subunit